LKRIKKLFHDKFCIKEKDNTVKPNKKIVNLEINLYRIKNELKVNKSTNEFKLNISYPYKEDQIEKLLKAKLDNFLI
jgi:hypothetical protein